MSKKIILYVLMLLILAIGLMAQPQLTLTTNQLDFGNVQLNTLKSLPFVIKNTGTGVLSVTTITSSNFAFTVQQAINLFILPNDSLVDTLVFKPRKAYGDTATIYFTSNDAGFSGKIVVVAYGEVVIDPSTVVYRNDAKGNVLARREGIMNGNQIATLFYNHGEVAKYKFDPSVVWPKGTNHSYLDGVAVLIGASTTAPGNGRKITPI